MYDEYKHWLPYIADIYLSICDSETGDFRTLPFEGAIMDQPYMTLNILRIVQTTYRKVLSDKNKEILEKAKHKRSR